MRSPMSVGDAISTAPDMQRYLVDRKGTLSLLQFNQVIALAQATCY